MKRFRGKTIDGGWVKGGLVPGSREDMYCIVTGAGAYAFVPVFAETVGQGTGLTDRSGREVFEGDIVETVRLGGISKSRFRSRVVIEAHGSAPCLVARRLDAYADTPDGPQPVFLRPEDLPAVLAAGVVIGNRHDNPELLKFW